MLLTIALANGDEDNDVVTINNSSNHAADDSPNV
jgi:hypothetical protein